jgi:hypothetical protein
MDTFEARYRLRELAHRGLQLIKGFSGNHAPAPEDAAALRDMAAAARSLIPDAGFPGESAWRALDHAAAALVSLEPDPEGARWRAVADELQAAIEQLNSLLGSARRDADFRIVG